MDIKKFIQEEVSKLHKKSLLENEKIKIEKELRLIKENKVIKEDYTLQYSEKASKESPIVKINYDDVNSLFSLGLRLSEEDDISVDELIEEVKKSYKNIRNKQEAGYGDDFREEKELLNKLYEFCKRAKMDGEKVVWFSADLNHNEDEWMEKNIYDYDDWQSKQTDCNQIRHDNPGLS